jgi:hypothetical protein
MDMRGDLQGEARNGTPTPYYACVIARRPEPVAVARASVHHAHGGDPMPDPTSPEAQRQHQRALSRWENEGGAAQPNGARPGATSDAASGIEVDAAIVAAGLGLDIDVFRALMDEGQITHLCERGVDADAGLWRVTFHYQARRVRLVVDATGNVVDRD